jgi:hypothetical protein
MGKKVFIVIVLMLLMGVNVYAADQVLTDKTAYTTPTDDDILYMVDDPGGTPADKKITRGNFFNADIDTGGTVNFNDKIIQVDAVGEIQTAIDTIEAAGGGTVVILEGTYVLTAKLTIDSDNVHLRGSGGTILQSGASLAANTHAIEISSADNCTISDLEIDGNKANQSNAFRLIRVIGSSTNTLIENCKLYNSLGIGLDIQGPSTFTTVRNLSVTGCSVGGQTATAGASDIIIADSLFQANTGDGFGTGAARVKFSNCTFDANGSDGLSINGGGSDFVVDNCIATNNTADGFDITTTERYTLTNCIANDNNVGYNCSTDANNGTIVNCVGYSNTTSGIANGGSGMHTLSIIGCDLTSNGHIGINQGAGENIIVKGNNCSFNGQDGIRFDGVTYGIVSGNICANNSQASATTYPGINIQNSDYVTIDGNYSFDNQASATQSRGIDADTSVTNILAYGNRSFDNDGADSITNTTDFVVNGNVGIGTTTPDRKLDVEVESTTYATEITNSHATSSRGLNLKAGSSSSNYNLLCQDKDGSAILMAILGDGNVGIGTATPDSNLELESASTANYLEIEDTGVSSQIKIGSNGSSTNKIFIEAGTDGTDDSIQFKNGGADTVIFNAVGNVGIGDTTPDAKLDVVGDAIITGALTVGDYIAVGSGSGIINENETISFHINAPTENDYHWVDLPAESYPNGFEVTDVIVSRDATQSGSLSVNTAFRTTADKDGNGSLTTIEQVTFTENVFRVEDDGSIASATVVADDQIGFYFGLTATNDYTVNIIGYKRQS